MCNNVLNVPVASKATISGYANDITEIIVAKQLADVELYSSDAINVIKKWQKNADIAYVVGKQVGFLLQSKERKP